MTLTRYRLGDLIEQSDSRNSNGEFKLKSVRGISTLKEFIKTKADMAGVPLSAYKIVSPKEFAFVPDTSRRGDKMSLAFNETNAPFLVSSISCVFKISKTDKILPNYLYIYFNRPEFDRYARFNSWGSARETFTWEDMCDIEIDLPSIEIQKKYVAIYKSMINNQKCYERGLNDLKLTCEAYVEQLRKNSPLKELGNYIIERNTKNSSGITNVLGISKDGFINPKQDVGDLDKYKEFGFNSFVYSPPRINVGSIGLYKESKKAICSPIYVVFSVKDESILSPDYLMILFKRDEFLRATDYYSLASVRNNFSFNSLCEMEFPIPPIEVQESISNIYRLLEKRKKIAEDIKTQISDLCSILIKGSLLEADK